jgi:N-acetylneuraminic acid mutarotase
MKNSRYFTRICLLVFLFSGPGLITSIQAQNGWETLTELPTNRWAHRSVYHDGKIYVIGGSEKINPSIVPYNEAYNVETEEWAVLTSMDNARAGLTVETLNDNIYVIGGVSSYEDQSSDIKEYDIKTDTWTSISAMPEPRFNHISETIEGNIYISGGLSVSKSGKHPGLTSSLIYDPVSDHWDTIADLNHERHLARSCIFDGKIYVFGGAPSGYPYPPALNSIEIYDPETDIWTVSEDTIPIPWMAGIAIVHEESILLFGGSPVLIPDKIYNNVYKYTPGSTGDKWTMMDPMPVDRYIMSGTKVANSFYLFGGVSGWNGNTAVLDSTSHLRFDLDSLKEWKVPCRDVLISQNTLSLEKGNTHVLSASVLPTNAADRSVLWSSSNESIAIVSPEGLVTAVSSGEAIISSSTFDGLCTASCEVAVIITVTGVSLDQNTLHLKNGDSVTLVATVSPPDATDPLITWWSDDDEIATVNVNGVVTGNSIDSTFIYVSTNDGGYLDSCQVIVTPGTGARPYQADNIISIYPNPANSMIIVETRKKGIYTLEIINLSGQVMKQIDFFEYSIQLNLSSYQNGIYMIRILSGDGVLMGRFIKV